MKSTSMLAPPKPKTRRANAGKYIEVDGVRVRYLEAGTANPGPPFVLLHGYRAGADIFNPHPLLDLAEEFHIIAPDLPGFAYSGRLRHYDLTSYSAFVNNFCDTLGLGTVNVMGHSMGAQVAIAAAVARPERFNKLVLVCPAGLPRKEPMWLTPFEMLSDASARHWRLYPTLLRLALVARASRESKAMIRHEHISSYLRELTMPTLIVWGSRDRIVPLEHGTLFARLIPDGRLALLRGAGHIPFYQKPEEFNRLVIRFLKQPSAPPNQKIGA